MRLRILPFLMAMTLTTSAAAAGAETPPRKAAVERIAPGPVDGPTARELVAEGVKVVDVRTAKEYSAGHVPGAIHLPYDQIADRHAELGPPATPLLLYCQSGRRSGIAVRALKEKGFTRLYDLGAYQRWVDTEPAKK